MTEKKETTHILVPHSLVLFIRPRSSVWQCRYQIDGKWQRESTKQRDLDKAKSVAHDLFVEANVRKKLKAAPITRAFKDIAKQAILRMEKQIEDGDGKVMYKEYISIVEKYLIKFFGKYKVDAITHPLIEEFEQWRIEKMGITPKRSTTLNHNAALNRVFDEAIYRGYMFEINRPKLVALGKKSERRPSFSVLEANALNANFDNWIAKGKADSVQVRYLLRDYVRILLDTGMRPGTEFSELTWGQIEVKNYPEFKHTGKIERDEETGEEEELIEFDANITAIIMIQKGKTGERNCVGRGATIRALKAICRRNYDKSLKDVIKEHAHEKILAYKELITTRQKNKNRKQKLIKPTSFNKLFDTYLKEHNLLIDPITNKRRVLYSLRHTYATVALQIDEVEIHTLSLQMGTSVGMIEQHYSHLDAVKAVHQLRGKQSRQLIEATGVIDKRYEWNENNSNTKKNKKVKP
jgi:integrase